MTAGNTVSTANGTRGIVLEIRTLGAKVVWDDDLTTVLPLSEIIETDEVIHAKTNTGRSA